MSTETLDASRDAAARGAPGAVLLDKLRSLRNRHMWVAALSGAAIASVVAIELLVLALSLDWWLDLPWGARLVLLGGQLAVFNALVYRFVFLPLAYPPDDDGAALIVEKARSEFRSSLISSVQLMRPESLPPGASRSMVGALVRQTEQIAGPLDFRSLIPTSGLRKWAWLAAGVCALGVAAFVWSRPASSDLLRRAFLANIPVPRKTRIVAITGDIRMPRGGQVRLAAIARGVLPDAGRTVLEAPGRRDQQLPLPVDPANPSRFARDIENVQESFDYRIEINDAVSPSHRVIVLPRPEVAALELDQIAPAYSGLGTRRRSLGDLSLLAGSRVVLKGASTKDLASASIRLVGLDRAIPMVLDPTNSRALRGEMTVPVKGLAGFSLDMEDTEGMRSEDSAVYRIDIVPDKPPSVRITYPQRREELITRAATMVIGFETSDDFKITELRLRAKIDTEPATDISIDLDLQNEQPSQVRRRYEWNIGAMTPMLSEGRLIEYWIEAVDNNDTTGPGVGSSTHQMARVVGDNEKRADLLNRAGDFLGTITDVTADQEKLNQSLGDIILER